LPTQEALTKISDFVLLSEFEKAIALLDGMTADPS
jgi:hypothetical protein